MAYDNVPSETAREKLTPLFSDDFNFKIVAVRHPLNPNKTAATQLSSVDEALEAISKGASIAMECSSDWIAVTVEVWRFPHAVQDGGDDACSSYIAQALEELKLSPTQAPSFYSIDGRYQVYLIDRTSVKHKFRLRPFDCYPGVSVTGSNLVWAPGSDHPKLGQPINWGGVYSSEEPLAFPKLKKSTQAVVDNIFWAFARSRKWKHAGRRHVELLLSAIPTDMITDDHVPCQRSEFQRPLFSAVLATCPDEALQILSNFRLVIKQRENGFDDEHFDSTGVSPSAEKETQELYQATSAQLEKIVPKLNRFNFVTLLLITEKFGGAAGKDRCNEVAGLLNQKEELNYLREHFEDYQSVAFIKVNRNKSPITEKTIPDWVIEQNNKFGVLERHGEKLFFEKRQSLSSPILIKERAFHKISGHDKLGYEDGIRKTSFDWSLHADRAHYLDWSFSPNDPTADRVYNRFVGLRTQPKAGPIPRDLVNYFKMRVCRGEADRVAYLSNWLAQLIKDPGSKPKIGLNFRGASEAEKELLFDFFGGLIGERYVAHFDELSYAVAEKNAALEDALVVICDNANFSLKAPDKVRLSKIISSPKLRISAPYKSTRDTASFSRLIIFSDNKFVPEAACDTSDIISFDLLGPSPSNEEISSLRAYIKKDTLEHVHYLLEQIDASVFDFGKAPSLPVLDSDVSAQLDDFSAFWLYILETGYIESAADDWRYGEVEFEREALGKMYEKWRDFISLVEERTHIHPETLKLRLREIYPQPVRVQRRRKGRRVDCYRLPNLAQCRSIFERFNGFQISWPIVKE